MKKSYEIDLFISHGWLFHDEWKEFVSIVNKIDNLKWRNFSVPWHDPAFLPTTEIGHRNITTYLKTQIIPCDLCIIITDLFNRKRNIKWLELEYQYAAEANITTLFFGKEIKEIKSSKINSKISINNWNFELIRKLIIENARLDQYN
tara:strand:+ start:2106 stop:2546 length:441 start_codon:yes stop_codon:yes gene_type:complete